MTLVSQQRQDNIAIVTTERPAQRNAVDPATACMGHDAALRNELRHGRISMASGETLEGMKAFSAGAGRHGKPRS
jgi:enoyl-CoA hydratase/carnithine racemase